MIRSTKYKLRMNKSKSILLNDLMNDYRGAVNHYIESFLKNTPKSRKNCYKDHDSNLLRTKRLEDNAAMTAHDIITSWLKGRKKNKPFFYGNIKLNAKNAQIQESRNSFDKWIYIQPLKIYLPFNLYKHKWIKGKELKEIVLIKKNDEWYVKISYEVEPKPIEFKKEITSIDMGINKLMTTPYGNYGSKKLKEKIKNYSNKLRMLRKRINKLGIKSSKRLKRLEEKFSSFLKNVYNREINKFIKNEAPKKVVVENLDIRRTKGKRSKDFNNRTSRSGLSGVKKYVQSKCEEHGIEFHKVNPAYTSQICPQCGHIDGKNRNDERFKCVSCGFKDDSDFVASINILRRFLRRRGDKDNAWWPLEFHHGVESRTPKSRIHVLSCMGSG